MNAAKNHDELLNPKKDKTTDRFVLYIDAYLPTPYAKRHSKANATGN